MYRSSYTLTACLLVSRDQTLDRKVESLVTRDYMLTTKLLTVGVGYDNKQANTIYSIM